jgi:hypothetical protein
MNKHLLLATAIVALLLTNCKSDKQAPEGGDTETPTAVETTSDDKAGLKICTQERLINSAHCCPEDLAKISIFESNSVLHLTGSFSEFAGKNPTITGIVRWDTGDIFPTKPITMVQDTSFGESCYVGKIQPINGVQWKLKKFKLQIQVDGKPYAEKFFEMDR